MPQLSPMSWVLVFGVLLVFLVLFMLSVWWGSTGEYKVACKASMGGVAKDIGCMVKWGFGKK